MEQTTPDLRGELLARLREPETRGRLVAALLGDGEKGDLTLKPGEALKLLDYIQEALNADSAARDLPDDTDMSAYPDDQLRAMLAELEAAPDG